MHITETTATKMIRLLMLVMAVLLFVIGYVFYQSYQGREDVIQNARRGCERAKLDRTANAQGWRIAQAARHASKNYAVARSYGHLAQGLETRSRVNCRKAFPDARLIPSK